MSRRYLFDTNAIGDFTYARKGMAECVAHARRIGLALGTCPPVVGEMYQGAENSENRDRSLREVKRGLKLFRLWPYDRAEAELYDRLAAHLKRTGRPMQTVDIQLAAVAFTLGNCTVVSTDSDLRAIPGLAVEDWTMMPVE